MFMRESTHLSIVSELKTEILTLTLRLNFLQEEWNTLVRRINKKGGEQFLNEARMGAPSPFTEEEMRKLLILCHPDKHGGKALAEEMTARILDLRKEQKAA